MNPKRLLFAAVFLFFCAYTVADEGAIHAALEKAGVREHVLAVDASEYPGWQHVWLRGGRIIYVTDDGNYLVQGNLIENTENGLVNLTARRQNMARAGELEQLPADSFITYRAENMQTYITVFTDVGCPFCHRLHQQVAELTANGVGVRYLPFPRRGIGSEDYADLLSVWCAEDRVAALEEAKKGKRIKKVTCDTHQVDISYELGRLMGVTGTPAIVFADGSLHVGFMDADSMLEKLQPQQ